MIEDKTTHSTARGDSLASAAALVAVAWGSNQFTPMLLVYHRQLGLGTGTLEAMFGAYALGLIPGLLIAGPLSDARGRRTVVVPAVAISLLATASLVAGAHSVALLFFGRLLAGISSGAVFGAGTAWLRELSRRRGAGDTDTARLAATAMTAGFALGPLIAGLLAQWAPGAGVVPYVPHLALAAAVLAALRSTPETLERHARGRMRLAAPGVEHPRFRRVVGPMAPWVFAAPAIGFALMPSVVGAQKAADGVALTATITALCALAGVLIQPLARRLEGGSGRNHPATTGLLVVVLGLALSAVTAQTHEIWMLVPSAVVLGAAYGICLVAGLVEIQRLAGSRGLGGLTAAFYTLTYLGFAAPYLLTIAARVASYATLLTIAAALALLTAAIVRTESARAPAVRQLPI